MKEMKTLRLVVDPEHLETAEAATSFSSGMGAISNTLFALLSPGDRVVSINDTYGGTNKLFIEFLPRFGIKVSLCDTNDHKAIETAIGQGCKALYLESPTNPTVKVVDLGRLAAALFARAHVQYAIGVDQELHLDARQPRHHRRNALQVEARQAAAIFRQLALALHHMDGDVGLPIHAGGEVLGRAGRNRRAGPSKARARGAVRTFPSGARRRFPRLRRRRRAGRGSGLR